MCFDFTVKNSLWLVPKSWIEMELEPGDGVCNDGIMEKESFIGAKAA